jgi:hypothetical protein
VEDDQEADEEEEEVAEKKVQKGKKNKNQKNSFGRGFVLHRGSRGEHSLLELSINRAGIRGQAC